MQLSRVLEACLYVQDLAAAERFYVQVLGLEVHSRVVGRHLFFRCGPGMFLLFNPQATSQRSGDVPTHGSHGPGHVAFAISPAEVDAWRARLASHDVAIEAEVTWPTGGRSLYFRDPAGNSLELATPQTWNISA